VWQRLQRGFSLPELMIALVLGLMLLAAFLVVLQRCRDQFAINDSLARLQDASRQALSVLQPDIEHAGFYGFSNRAKTLFVRAGAVLAAGEQLQQPSAEEAVRPVAGLPAGSHDCGDNFAVDVNVPVQGSNNLYALGVNARDCAPTASAGGARAGSDTLTLRHASLAVGPAHAGRIQLYAPRLELAGPLQLFGDGRAPGTVDDDHEVRELEVRTYYIANDSVGRASWPALRVKALTESGGRAQFRDEEILTGVEDLQIEFGLGSLVDGARRVRYVTPDAVRLPAEAVVAVRLWLRVRADTTERGYVDARTLNYSDVSFTPSAFEATQRRLLIERTVALRNRVLP
jgi:type IV pilus assembly protein PilW